MFLGAVPAIAASAGTRDWIVAIVLERSLWRGMRSTRDVPSALGAEPVDAPAIRSRFAQLANECGLPEVTLHQVPTSWRVFHQCGRAPVDLPPAVVVTDTLLARSTRTR